MQLSENSNNEKAMSASLLDNEIRGVWHRPNSSEKETDLDGLCAVLDQFKNAGINLVFVESFYHGMALFKTHLAPYHVRVEEYSYGDYPDYLTAFTEEAAKRGINVFAWVQDFYVGFRDNAQLIVDHPNWMLLNQNGDLRHTTEGQGFGGYLFLDPANPEVRNYLIDLYDDLLEKIPQIKGLNLDYIRYPISEIEENTDTGYTEICIRGFADKLALELDNNNLRESFHSQMLEHHLENQWIAHRAEYITTFVAQVRELIDTKHSGKMISTAVFAEVEQTYNLKKQNVKVWLERGYVNFVTPMVYFYEAQRIYDSVVKLKEICKGINCYTGLYTTYHKQSNSELEEHIKASMDAGAHGFVLFDAAKTFFEAAEDYYGFLNQKYGTKKFE